MQKLRTLLVDDEPLALNFLRSIVSKIDDIEIIGECKNGREAIESVMLLAPDLIFLDIQPPGTVTGTPGTPGGTPGGTSGTAPSQSGTMAGTPPMNELLRSHFGPYVRRHVYVTY